MSRLTVNSDGSADVFGFMARSFLPMNHIQYEIISLDVLSALCVTYAFEHDWLKCPSENESLGEEAHKTEDMKEYSGVLPTEEDDSVFFFAGVECILKNSFTSFNLPPVHTSVNAMGRVVLTYVGHSTIGLHVDLYIVSSDNESERKIIGGFNVICVHISKKKRTPVPLPSLRKKFLESALEHMKGSIPKTKWERYTFKRIDGQNEIALSNSCLSASVDGNIARKLIRTVTLPGNKFLSSYRRKHHLRESDIDYNLHLNQYRVLQLVVDAFRGATGDGRCILSRVVPSDQSYIVGDLLIRELRIDYLKEVPMDVDAVEVHLFLVSEEDEAIIANHAEEHSFEHRVTVHFVCRAYPTFDSSEGVYPASVGLLQIAV